MQWDKRYIIKILLSFLGNSTSKEKNSTYLGEVLATESLETTSIKNVEKKKSSETIGPVSIKKARRFLKITKNRASLWASNSTPRYLSKDIKTLIFKSILSRKDICIHTCSSQYHLQYGNNPIADKWMNKRCIYNEVLI